jgi:hypothetical protein
MPRRTRNQLVAAAGTVLLGSSASWLLTMQKAHSTVEQEVANGWPVEANATPATLAGDARSRYSLSPDSTYASETSSDGQWRGIVPGVATEADEPRSRWAVFTTTQVLSVEECTSWVARAEALELEDGDFIFATGGQDSSRGWRQARGGTAPHGSSTTRSLRAPCRSGSQGRCRRRLPTGADSASSSRAFSKYVPGQYFAPHFDGRGAGLAGMGRTAEFTAVLYLSNDFVGGATHYLPGQGSEVAQAVALRPCQGCAAVHRQGSVLHAGGAVESGTKYIMQFLISYDAPRHAESRRLTNLRWGA